jgi:photosystem II stability/assembly factor-like uncharacterized protein
MIKISPFIFFLFWGFSLFAQNWNTYYSPRSRQIHDIQIHNPERICIVGGHPTNDSITYMAYSENGATEWLTFNDIYPGKMINTLLFYNNLSGFCAGDNQTLYATTDGGKTWENRPLNISLSHRDIKALCKTQYGISYAVGGKAKTNGFIIKSIDLSQTWSSLNEWPENEILSVASPQNDKIRVCGHSNFIQLSDDQGEIWTDAVIVGLSHVVDLTSISFFNENLGYCVGGISGPDSVAVILKTIDSGQTWESVYEAVGPKFNDISIIDSDVAYAVGDYGIILKTIDGGQTWSEEIIPDLPVVDLYSVKFLNSHIGGITGQWGTVFIYNDGSSNLPESLTLEASQITNNSAKLNGTVNPGFSDSQVYFYYGTSTIPENGLLLGTYYGGEILNINTLVENLSENTKYYFQIKLENSYGEYFGEVKSFYTGNPVPNWDFEDWSIYENELPDNWFTVGNIEKSIYDNDTVARLLPVSTLQDNSSRVSALLNARLEIDTTVNGDLYIVENSGGFAINYKPTQMHCKLKYNIEIGDSALVLIATKSQGEIISENYYYLQGNSGGSFTDLNFDISYLNSETPDTIILGFTNTDVKSKTIIFNSTLEISKVWFDIEEIVLPNSEFSNFSTVTYEYPDNWYSEQPEWLAIGQEPSLPYFKDLSSYHNDYAICLQTQFQENDTILGKISVRDYEDAFPLNYRHENFQGYYKYLPEFEDSASITLVFYKDGLVVGSSMKNFFTETSTWQSFNMPIIYFDENIVPDSANIFILSTKETNPQESIFCIDKLCFDGDYIPVEEYTNIEFSVYPNPFTDVIHFINENKNENILVKIIDINGKCVSCDKIESTCQLTLDTNFLQRGFYMLTVGMKAEYKTIKLVKL